MSNFIKKHIFFIISSPILHPSPSAGLLRNAISHYWVSHPQSTPEDPKIILESQHSRKDLWTLVPTGF
jgi:hypothetical protein